MRSVVAKGVGGPEVLSVVRDALIPKLVSQEHVLLRVKATAVNRADTAQRKGLYPPPPGAPTTLGLEACGVVEEVGSNAVGINVGDKVMALLGGGGYGEFVSVHSKHLMALPQNLSFAEGAAIAEVYLTAWQCLRFNMDVQKGQYVLLHAGASGIGTAAAQLVQKVIGGTAIATCSEKKVQECMRYSKFAVSRTPEETVTVDANGTETKSTTTFESKVRKLLGDTPLINAVIDPVFGDSYLTETVNLCAQDAAITVLAMMGGSTLSKFNASTAFRKRINIKFSTLRSRDDEYKAKLVESFTKNALPYFSDTVDEGSRLKPVIDKVLPIEEVVAAHTLIDASDSIGKIVLTF
eukprot:GILI01008781.1.p1 GENE.GILI01008781.1~~GILI01008781.1.p1  ORF type:complete len:370 (+),score=50.74 GILI01008781.1:58-1110(+)